MPGMMARYERELTDGRDHTRASKPDRLFMQVRRSIAGLERAPAHPAAPPEEVPEGFYSPQIVEKALAIYRSYSSFIFKGADRKAPPRCASGWPRGIYGSRTCYISSQA
jgi:hypothetical protein